MALAETKETKNINEVLKTLDFKFEKRQACIEGTNIPIPGRVVCRVDTPKPIPIAWVGESYGLVPHGTILKPLLTGLGDEFDIKKTVIERHGRRVMVEALSKESWSVVRGDRVHMKLCFVNSLDRTSSLKLMFGAFRLLCSNGMGMFMNGYTMNIREPHTKLLEERVTSPTFQHNLGQLATGFKEGVKLLSQMAERKVDDKQAEKLISDIIGKKSVTEIMHLWTAGRGQNGDKTAWALYNGASQHLTDLEVKAILPVAAKVRTMKKTTALLRALNN